GRMILSVSTPTSASISWTYTGRKRRLPEFLLSKYPVSGRRDTPRLSRLCSNLSPHEQSVCRDADTGLPPLHLRTFQYHTGHPDPGCYRRVAGIRDHP